MVVHFCNFGAHVSHICLVQQDQSLALLSKGPQLVNLRLEFIDFKHSVLGFINDFLIELKLEFEELFFQQLNPAVSLQKLSAKITSLLHHFFDLRLVLLDLDIHGVQLLEDLLAAKVDPFLGLHHLLVGVVHHVELLSECLHFLFQLATLFSGHRHLLVLHAVCEHVLLGYSHER